MEQRGLESLEIYKIARELSSAAWVSFQSFNKQIQFSTGEQFLRAIDSIGANIAEGFGRFHYKDSLRFYYISRGSIYESIHWVELLEERKLISKENAEFYHEHLNKESLKLNLFINAIKLRMNNGTEYLKEDEENYSPPQ